MSCEEFQTLITAYVDDELASEQRRRVEEHLADCDECKRRVRQAVELKENLAMIKFKEPSDKELDRYWGSVYNRLERGLGWILFSLGAIVLLCFGAFKLIEETIRDPQVAVAVKVGVVALICGLVILLVSLVRERLRVRRVDKYSKEVER